MCGNILDFRSHRVAGSAIRMRPSLKESSLGSPRAEPHRYIPPGLLISLKRFPQYGSEAHSNGPSLNSYRLPNLTLG